MPRARHARRQRQGSQALSAWELGGFAAGSPAVSGPHARQGIERGHQHAVVVAVGPARHAEVHRRAPRRPRHQRQEPGTAPSAHSPWRVSSPVGKKFGNSSCRLSRNGVSPPSAAADDPAAWTEETQGFAGTWVGDGGDSRMRRSCRMTSNESRTLRWKRSALPLHSLGQLRRWRRERQLLPMGAARSHGLFSAAEVDGQREPGCACSYFVRGSRAWRKP